MTGRKDEARQQQRLFEAARNGIPADLPINANNPAREVLKVGDLVLQARLEADLKKAIELWKNAVAVQDGLVYDEPPPWYQPLRESLGAALLLNGQAAEAEKVFREDLARNPRSPRSLFGLCRTLQALGRNQKAAQVHQQFLAAWKGAAIALRLEDF